MTSGFSFERLGDCEIAVDLAAGALLLRFQWECPPHI
jgi:hypothetical protein